MKIKISIILLLFINSTILFPQKTQPDHEESHPGYKPLPFELNFEHLDLTKIHRTLKSGELPSRYDLREEGLITSVKNQGGTFGGNCWSFTALGAVESQWLKMGYDTFDLSEQNLATCHGFEWGYGEGGNDFLALAYLTRLQGPVLETDDPYDANDTNQLNCETCHEPVAYVTDARWLPKNNQLIKQTIYDYGAISVSMYWNNYSYHAEPYYNYFYSGNSNVNHAVIIAGWDDNYPTPTGAGAWIVKNQWGSDWADSGYFYIAYEDAKIAKTASFYPVKKSLNAIHKIYYYDTLSAIRMTGFTNESAYGLTRFTTNSTEFIHKIGTFTASAGSILDIEIYEEKDGNNLSGLLYASRNNYCPLPGYYTFDVAAEVSGDFYVKVKYFAPGETDVLPIEIPANKTFADPHVLTGEGIKNPGFTLDFRTLPGIPGLENTFPADSAKNVSIHTPVMFSMNQAFDSLNFSGIMIASPTDTLQNLTFDIDTVTRSIHVAYPDSMEYNTTYTVLIPDSMVLNDHLAVNRDTSWQFTTIATGGIHPEIYQPLPFSNDHHPDSALYIKMNDSVLANDINKVMLTKSSPGEQINLQVQLLQDHETLKIIPASLEYSTRYDLVLMDSAIVSRNDSSPVADFSLHFSTIPGKPVLTKQYPVHNAKSVSINTSVYGKFNQECTDAGLSVKLVDDQNSVTGIDSIAWDEHANNFILYPRGLEYNTMYSVIIADSSVVNNEQEYNDTIAWSFHTATEAQPVVQTSCRQLETKLSSDSLLQIVFSENIEYLDTTGILVFNNEDTLNADFKEVKGRTLTVEIPTLEQNTTYTFKINDSTLQTTGMNWISGNGIVWEAAGKGITQHYHDLCIRAYSDTSGNPVALFTSNKQKVCPRDTVILSDFSAGNITGYAWDFGEDAVPSTANTRGPHKIVYQSEGLKSISLIVDDGTNADTLDKFNFLSVTDNIHVYIPEDEKEIPLGKSDTIKAFGADTYKWFPTYGLDTSGGGSVVLTPVEMGDYVYYVYGTQGHCSNLDSIVIHATRRPVNDDACSADTIIPGINGPYTNVNASVEINEPHPPTPYSPSNPSLGCNTQSTWCKEYNYETLANSIWFTFTAPASGKISLGTKAPSSDTEKEFDTQIALYKAKTCQDILSGNYTLIAANDDHFGWQHHFAAGIELIDTLTPGATYWLQLDGSARGEEGECYITFSEYLLDIKEPEGREKNDILLFPNPCIDKFNIIVSGSMVFPLSLNIVDMKGSPVLQTEIKSKSALHDINVNNLKSGTYVVTITDRHQIYHNLLIIN